MTPVLFWPLLLSVGLSALWTLATIWAMDRRADARAAHLRAKRRPPVTIAPSPIRLPRAVATPTAWRNGRWSS